MSTISYHLSVLSLLDADELEYISLGVSFVFVSSLTTISGVSYNIHFQPNIYYFNEFINVEFIICSAKKSES
jgi:hypothetical protein